MFGDLLVVHIARIASSEAEEVGDKDVLATLGDVEDLTRNTHFLTVERIFLSEPNLIKRLVCRTEGFVDLQLCSENREKTE